MDKCAMCGKDFEKQEDSKDCILICQDCFKTLRLRRIPKKARVVKEKPCTSNANAEQK